ncbi:hemin-degrading factor [Stappia sp.]|uniref:hemin-degrading factor n=1 Tax=Stappia sp. TaxID=1870903 RepID=UPI003D10D762
MTRETTDFDHIRRMRDANPKMRERDLAAMLELSEAEFVAAFCGDTVRRIDIRFDDIFKGLEAVGEVLALTRNESAVHEKAGVYDKFIPGQRAAMMLGADIDTRMFPAVWVHGFAVAKPQEDGTVRHSLQFFDAHGDAVHKIHTRDKTDLGAWEALVTGLLAEDQEPGLLQDVVPAEVASRPRPDAEKQDALRERWQSLTDPHQFHGMLRDLDLHRLNALTLAGEHNAWVLDPSAVADLLQRAAEAELPIMCFVGSRGCIQIHSGPVAKIASMGPWINVMDPGFHLHLRTDHIAEAWAVRKPTKDGHVTSVEAYDANGTLIIQFFGLRKEGNVERSDWRELVQDLPRPEAVAAE